MATGIWSKLKNFAKKVAQSAPKTLEKASKVAGTAAGIAGMINPAAGAALGAAAAGTGVLANMTRKGGVNSSNINSLLSSGKSLYSAVKNRNSSN